MAKFEGTYPDKTPEAPKWFQIFLENYKFVVKYLIQIGKNGVGFSNLITSVSFNARVEHSKAVSIPHNLGVTPTSITVQGGRVESYSVKSSDARTSIVSVRLLSTPTIDIAVLTVTNQVNVLDATLFNVGDSVLINNQTRKITAIVGNTLSLDNGTFLQPPCVVTLNQENLNFVLF